MVEFKRGALLLPLPCWVCGEGTKDVFFRDAEETVPCCYQHEARIKRLTESPWEKSLKAAVRR